MKELMQRDRFIRALLKNVLAVSTLPAVIACREEDTPVPQSADRNRIMELDNDWIRYYLAADAVQFGNLLDENFVYSSERGVFTKQAYVANLASGVIKITKFVNSEVTVRVFGDTAVTTGIATLSATLQGQDISGPERFTRVWRRTGNDYKAIAQHANMTK